MNVLETPVGSDGRFFRVTAMSPVQVAISASLSRFASYLPDSSGDQAIGHAPEFQPNYEAVVIHIDWGDDAVLLGSDLEEHATCAWTALMKDPWCRQRRMSTAYKVAHHGSVSSHADEIWADLLVADPAAGLTPFNLGRHKLPTDDDKSRIRSLSTEVFNASGATRRPELGSNHVKRLDDICKGLSGVNAAFGAVRLPKRPSEPDWRVQLFGAAQKL